ncbi:MAG: flavodoxin domain-containing protein [Candidatus Bathyarchaeia archaeon]
MFESRYGNTRRVAKEIIVGANEVGGVEVSLKELREVDISRIPEYDVILIGSPNHMGGPTRGIKGFISKLGELQLEGKKFAVFDTYMGRDFEKAVRKMEKQISERDTGLKRIVAGLSIKVKGIKGPVEESELPKCKDFGRSIAAQLKES